MNLIHRLIAFVTGKHAGVLQVNAVIGKAKQQVAKIEAGAQHIADTIEEKVQEIGTLHDEVNELALIKADAQAFANKLKALFT